MIRRESRAPRSRLVWNLGIQAKGPGSAMQAAVFPSIRAFRSQNSLVAPQV